MSFRTNHKLDFFTNMEVISHILVLTVILGAANGQTKSLYCYVCNDAESNEECNKNPPVLCASNEYTCQTEVRVARGSPGVGPKYRITKRCKQEQACLTNMKHNNMLGGEFTQCNNNARARMSVCRYCCKDESVQGCNKDIEGISQPSCPLIAAPDNGRLDCDSNNPADRKLCNVVCDPFYIVTDPTATVLTCGPDGKWSSAVPTCDNSIGRGQDTATCPRPKTTLKNGSWKCSKKCDDLTCDADTTCVAACNDGFQVVGAVEGTCKPDKSGTTARWTSTIMDTTCEAIRCTPFVIPNAVQSCIGEFGQYAYKAVCQIRCKEDREYLLEGPSAYVCDKYGKWTDGISSCRPKCPKPTIAMGQVTCDSENIIAGVSCKLQCSAGYRPVDKTTAVLCQNDGTWSQNLAPCEQISCPAPTKIANGKLSCTGFSSLYTSGAECIAVCNPGYDLLGTATRKCLPGGSWSGTDPQCIVKKCPTIDVSAVANGKIICTGTNGANSVGANCTIVCNTGYVVVGQSSKVCQPDGFWSGGAALFLCQAKRCEQPQFANGKYSCDNKNYEYKSTCRPICDQGYDVAIGGEIQCNENGLWIGNMATCKAQRCSDIVSPTKGTLACTNNFNVGSVCTAQCNVGYKTTGSYVATCLSDGWDAKILPSVCIPSCRELKEPDNGGLICSEWEGGYGVGRYTKICQTTCNENFIASQPEIRVCHLTGYWSDESNPECKVQCMPPPKPQNGDFRCSGLTQSGVETEGTVCQLACAQGFKAVGTILSTTCQADRTWTYTDAVCQQSLCDALIKPSYGDTKCTSAPLSDGKYPVGTECITVCSGRSAFDSVQNKRVCSDNGQWTGTNIVCPVDCLYVWSSWSACNYKGSRSRKAIVLISPKNGGKQCPQELTRTEECCQVQYKTLGKSCFSFHCDNQTWASAEENCRKIGGSLAKIDNMLKQRVLKDVLQQYRLPAMWIGLSRTNGRFRWTDGTALGDYDQWYELRGVQRQPDQYRNLEDCGQIASGWPTIVDGTPQQFDWNDADCNSHTNYICENSSGTCAAPQGR